MSTKSNIPNNQRDLKLENLCMEILKEKSTTKIVKLLERLDKLILNKDANLLQQLAILMYGNRNVVGIDNLFVRFDKNTKIVDYCCKVLVSLVRVQSPTNYFKFIFDRLEYYDKDEFILNRYFNISRKALEIILNEKLTKPTFNQSQELLVAKLLDILEFVDDDSTVMKGLECMMIVVDIYPGILKANFTQLMGLLIGIAVDSKVSSKHRDYCKSCMQNVNVVENWPENLDYYKQLTNDFAADIEQELRESFNNHDRNRKALPHKILLIGSVFQIISKGLLHDFNLVALVGNPFLAMLFQLPLYKLLSNLSLDYLNVDLIEISNYQ